MNTDTNKYMKTKKEKNTDTNIGSVPNSSSGLIFVKIRADSGRIFNKNPGKIRAKIGAKC